MTEVSEDRHRRAVDDGVILQPSSQCTLTLRLPKPSRGRQPRDVRCRGYHGRRQLGYPQRVGQARDRVAGACRRGRRA